MPRKLLENSRGRYITIPIFSTVSVSPDPSTLGDQVTATVQGQNQGDPTTLRAREGSVFAFVVVALLFAMSPLSSKRALNGRKA